MFTSLKTLPPCLNTTMLTNATSSTGMTLPSPTEPTTATTMTSESFYDDNPPASPMYGYSPVPHRDSRSSMTSFIARYEQLPLMPVPLGHLLSKDSFRFARIRFIVPPIESLSPVSSVFLDFEYSLRINVTVSSSFGGNRRLAGNIPIRIVTSRKYKRDKCDEMPTSSRSYRDSYSSLNLKLNSIPDNASHVSSSPTLSDAQLGGSSADAASESRIPISSSSDNFPTVQSFVQQGQRIPIPVFEAIKISN